MKLTNTLGRFAAWLAVLGFCLPMTSVAGDVPAPVRTGGAIADVALAPGGVLVGRVVDAQGQPTPAILVSIHHSNREVARTTSDQNGTYVFHGLQGGVYHIVSGKGTRICRLWAAQTAPPSAQDSLFIVSNPNAVLAQWETGSFGAFLENAKCTLTNPLVIGGIIAASVAIPVAIHNSKDSPSGS